MGRTTTVSVLLLALIAHVALTVAQVTTYQVPTIADFTYNYGEVSGQLDIVSDGTPGAVDNTFTVSCSGCYIYDTTPPKQTTIKFVFASGSASITNSFRIVPTIWGQVTLTFSLSSSQPSAFTVPNPVAFKVNPGTIDGLYNFGGDYVGVTQTASIYPDQAPINSLIVTFGSLGNVVQFTPPSLTFTDDSSQDIQYRSTASGPVSITVSFSGADGNNFQNPGFTNITFGQLTMDVDFGSLVFGQPTYLSFWEHDNQNAVESLKITPTCPGATINPTTATMVPVTGDFSNEVDFIITPNKVGTFNITYTFAGADFTATPDRWVLPKYDTVTVAPLNFDIGSFPSTFTYGQISAPITASLDFLTLNDVTIRPHSDNNNLVFIPATFVFTATTQTVTYRVKATGGVTTSFNVYFTIEGTDAAAINAPIANQTASITGNVVSVPTVNLNDITQGRTGAFGAFPVSIPVAPADTLTVYFNVSQPAHYVVTPAYVNFGPSTPLTATFSVSAIAGVTPSNDIISYYLGGPAANLYTLNGVTGININTDSSVTMHVPSGSWSLMAGDTLGPFTVSLDWVPTSAFTVALSADTSLFGDALTFTPATLSFSATTWSAQYWVTANVPMSNLGVTYKISSPADKLFAQSGTTTFTVMERDTYSSISWMGETTLNVGDTTTVTLALPALALASDPISVKLIANGVTFNPNPVPFTAGSFLAQVTVTANVAGSIAVIASYPNNVAWFHYDGQNIQTLSVVNPVPILHVPSSYASLEAAGAVSDTYTMYLTGAVTKGVNVTISAPGVTFTPNPVVFAAGDRTKTFTYTAAGAIPSDTQVVYTLSGTDASIIANPGASDFDGDHVLDLAEISITFPAGTEFGIGDVFYGFAVINRPTPHDVTVTPNVPALLNLGAPIVFTPSSFAFSGTTTTVPFSAVGTAVTGDYGYFSVNFQISGTDAALYSTVEPIGITIDPQDGMELDIDGPEVILGEWTSGYLNLYSVFPSDVTVTLSADASVDIQPKTFTVPANLGTAYNQEFKVKASKLGIYIITATISGVPASSTYDAEGLTTLSAIFVEQPSIEFDEDLDGAEFTVGNLNGPFTIYIDHYAGPVTVTPHADGITFTPSSISFGDADNVFEQAFFATANAYTGNSVYVTYSVGGTGAANYDASSILSALHEVDVYARDISCNFNDGNHLSFTLGITEYDVLVCDINDPVLNSITIVPSGTYITFSPASAVVKPGTTQVTFNATASALRFSGDRVYNGDGTLALMADLAVTGTDAALYQFSHQHFTDISVSPRFITMHGIDANTNQVYWGDNLEFEYKLDAPVLTNLVLTPKETRFGFTFTPLSITLSPGMTKAAFSLFVDPAKMVTDAYDWSDFDHVSFSLGVSGGDANSTVCPGSNGDCYWSSDSILNLPSYNVAHPPSVMAFEVLSREWTITMDQPVANGVTITPKSATNVKFIPSSWIFAAGDVQQSIQYIVYENSDHSLDAGWGAVDDIVLIFSGPDAPLYALSYDDSEYHIHVHDNDYQVDVNINIDTSEMYLWQPFVIEFDASDYLIQGVSELIITPIIPGGVATPASVTISAAQPYATVQAVFNSLKNPGAGDNTVYAFYHLSGADAHKFENLGSTEFTVHQYGISVDSISTLTAFETSGPYYVQLSPAPLESVTVTIDAPAGISITPSNVFTFDSTNLNQVYWVTPTKNFGGNDIRIIARLSGANSDAYAFNGQLLYNGQVNLRSIDVPSASDFSASFLPTYHTITLDAPVNGLTIVPYADGLTFTPAVIEVAPGQTVATFSVVASSRIPVVVMYNISGADAAFYYQPSATSDTYEVDALNAFYFNTGLGAVETLMYEQKEASVSTRPPHDVTLTPSSPGVVFTPSEWVFGPNIGAVSYNFKYTGDVSDFAWVTFKVSGTDAEWYTVPQPVVVALDRATPKFSDINGATGFPSSFVVGVPQTVFLTLQDANFQLPAAGKSVTFTPHSTHLEFTPSSFMFDSNTPSIEISVVGTIITDSAYVYFTVDDDETYNAPDMISSIEIDSVSFVNGNGLSNLHSSVPSIGFSSDRVLEITTPLDIQLTPVILSGDISFSPSMIDFSTSAYQTFTYSLGTDVSYDNPHYAFAWTISGSDADKFDHSTLVPTTFTVSNYYVISTPGGFTVSAGSSHTFWVQFQNSGYLPEDSVTLLMSANGLTLSASSITLSATSQATLVTVTPTGFTTGTLNEVQIIFSIDSSTADGKKFSLTNYFCAVEIDRASFNLPDFSDTVLLVGQQAGPFTAYITYPAVADVTLTPSAPGLVFTAADNTNALTFSADNLYVDFYITATFAQTTDIDYISWAVSGTDAWAYNTPGSFGIQAVENSINIDSFWNNADDEYVDFYNGETVGPFIVALDNPILGDTTVVFTPSAPGVTFNPASVTFDSTHDVFEFTMTQDVGATGTSPYIKFDLDVTGAEKFATINPILYSAVGSTNGFTYFDRNFGASLSVPVGNYGASSPYLYSLYLYSATPNGLTVQPSATGVEFSAAVFPAGSDMAWFAVTSADRAVTDAPIAFEVSGADAELYMSTIGATTITTTLKSFDYTHLNYKYLHVGIESEVFSFWVVGGMTPTQDVTVTPWAAGLTFTPPTFKFNSTVNSVDFTITPTNGGIESDRYQIEYTISGDGQFEFAPIDDSHSRPRVALYKLDVEWCGESLIVGIESCPVTVSYQYADNIGDILLTPVGFGLVFSPPSFTLSAELGLAQFTITPQFSFPDDSAPVYVSFEASGDGAHYLDPTTLVDTLNFYVYNRTITVPGDLGRNYVGVQSLPVVISLDYLPITGSVTVTPLAPGATFTPASYTFTSTSAPYTTFTFVHELNSGDYSVSWLLSGSEGMFYDIESTGDPTSYTAVTRYIDIETSSSDLVPGQNGWIDISIQYAPPTQLIVNLVSAITLSATSVTFSPTSTSTRVSVSGNPGDYTVYFKVSGTDAWMYSNPSTSSFTVNKFQFAGTDISSYVSDEDYIEGQESKRFTISIKNGFLSQAVTLIPYSPYMTFNPAVFQFNANTQFVTGTFTMTSQAIRESSFDHQLIWTVAGAGASLCVTPDPVTVTPNGLSAPYFGLSLSTSSLNVAVGVQSASFSIGALTPPPKSITVTPFVPGSPGVVFTPPSQILTPSSMFATFSLVAPFVGSTTVEFDITGPSASLFNYGQQSLTLNVARRNFLGVPGDFGTIYPLYNSTSVLVSLDYPPTTSVTLNLFSVSGTVTINPSTLTFTPSTSELAVAIVGTSINQLESIHYTVTGPDAQYYNVPSTSTVTFNAINSYFEFDSSVTQSNDYSHYPYTYTYKFQHGVPRMFDIYVDIPPVHDLTFTLSAAGFEFSGPVVIAAGSYTASAYVTSIGYGGVASSVTVQMSGQDAPLFLNPIGPDVGAYVVFATNRPTYTFNGALTNGAFDIGVTYDLNVVLSAAAQEDISFGCVSNLLEIDTLVVPAGHTGTSVNVVATQAGTGSFECFLQGTESAIFTLNGDSNFWFTVYNRKLAFTDTGVTGYNAKSVTVGGWTSTFDFALTAGASGASLPTPNSINISFVASPAGSVIFDPPTIYVAYPSSSFSFRASPQTIGDSKVTLVVTGVDADLYDPASTPLATLGVITVSGIKRSISVMSGSGVLDRVVYALDHTNYDASSPYQLSYLHLLVGVESRPITVTVGSLPTKVSIVLEGRGLTFNPSVLHFTGTYESLSFTITATEAFSGFPTYVHFTVTGDDAALFGAVGSMKIFTAPNFQIPDFPLLTINQAVTQTITVLSNITTPIILTPSVGNAVFLPEKLLFSAEKPSATFQIVGTALTVPQQNLNMAGTGFVNFNWRYMTESTSVSNKWYPPAGDVHINVLPGSFLINFPHLQIGQTSTVTVSTNVAPRSDVVLTLIGNNLNFNPPSMLFTKSNTQATIQVTPVHSDYQVSQDIPFSVDYYVSGSNAADFDVPHETYLAVSRGSAPQADSLVLSSASSTAASVVVLIAALLALLL